MERLSEIKPPVVQFLQDYGKTKTLFFDVNFNTKLFQYTLERIDKKDLTPK